MRAFSSFGLLGIASCWNDYEGYQKISIDFKSADLGKKIVSYLETLPSYDEWQLDQQRVEFIINKDDHSALLAEMDTFFRDIESIKSSRFSVAEPDVPTGLYLQDYDQYLTNDQLDEWFDWLAISFSDLDNGFVLRQEEIGRSYENRAMKGFSLRNPAKDLPWIVIDCGIHSREFISHATCRNLLINLVECAADGASCDGDFESLYEFNWYIMPNLNPDGYEYNWTTDRMWRKNRTPTQGSICMGVDLNRNSDVAWATVGASDNPCSNTYYGTAPFGEPEMAAWNSTIGAIHEQGDIEVYISFHAYAQKLLSSWAVDFSIIPDEPPTLAELQAAGAAATQAMTAAHGKTYLYGQSRDSLYPSSGTSKDYAMDVLKVPLSWTWELRDTGDYGFLLP